MKAGGTALRPPGCAKDRSSRAMSNKSPPFLEKKNPQLLLFGGKGGTGKTTSACAAAMHLARLDKKRKVLIASTDPAHSVGDSFDCEVGEEIVPIKGVDNLWALEIKAEKEDREFNEKYSAVMKKIADRGTYFDREDIENFFSLTLPGLDEVMAIIRIAKILKEGRYDRVVLDTAPTGHTIRLLALPKEMEKWTRLMEMMQSKHRFLTRSFTGRYKADDADEFLKMMHADIGRVRMLLSNPRTTEFVPVTIAEPMAIDETDKLLTRLRRLVISSNNVIVNRIAAKQGGCGFCASRAEDQKDGLEEIERRFRDYNLYRIPLFSYEVRGLERLAEFSRCLFGESRKRKDSRKPVFAPRLRPGFAARPQAEMSDLFNEDLRFLLLGGKGGVGKTSIASATALRMAERRPDKKVLIFSTDPAHSLSDCFGSPIGDRVTPIGGLDNLFGFEIDAARLLEDWKKGHIGDIEEMFDRFIGTGVDIKFDREIMTELVSVTPPGLDEIMALGEITDLIEAKRFDLYVLDSAATGHLLRFLELPQLLRRWLKVLFNLFLKYKGVIKLTQTAQEMVDLSRKVRMIQKLLTDSGRTEFVAATLPEEMALAESDRLLARLEDLKIPCRHVIVNMIVPVTGCGFCDRKAQEQQRYMRDAAGSRYSHYRVHEAPLLPHKVKGKDDLMELSAILYGRSRVPGENMEAPPPCPLRS